MSNTYELKSVSQKGSAITLCMELSELDPYEKLPQTLEFKLDEALLKSLLKKEEKAPMAKAPEMVGSAAPVAMVGSAAPTKMVGIVKADPKTAKKPAPAKK